MEDRTDLTCEEADRLFDETTPEELEAGYPADWRFAHYSFRG